MVAHAMYALECELIHDEDHLEGPFAEVTGYYATVAPSLGDLSRLIAFRP